MHHLTEMYNKIYNVILLYNIDICNIRDFQLKDVLPNVKCDESETEEDGNKKEQRDAIC